MNAKPIVLKVLLQHRHLQTHSTFCREYDRVAADIDPTLKGGWPSKAQFYRWLSGDLIGIPSTVPRADKPSETMAKLGVIQLGDPLLRQQARPFALPEEAEDARRVVAELQSALERVAQAHVFGKGMGIAAPQIGIERAAAIVRTPGGETISLLNPQIIDQSDDQDEQYEGCLSFFDVRGKVPRPLRIQVEHQHVDGSTHITVFERGVARLVAHEIDHLAGVLYTDRMADSASVIPVEQYRGGGQSWQYVPTQGDHHTRERPEAARKVEDQWPH